MSMTPYARTRDPNNGDDALRDRCEMVVPNIRADDVQSYAMAEWFGRHRSLEVMLQLAAQRYVLCAERTF